MTVKGKSVVRSEDGMNIDDEDDCTEGEKENGGVGVLMNSTLAWVADDLSTPCHATISCQDSTSSPSRASRFVLVP